MFCANNRGFYFDHYGQIQQAASEQDFKRNRLQEAGGDSLKGCIERDGELGKIEVTPFSVSIKGLDSDYDFSHTFKTAEWKDILGFLQHKAIQNP
jgi:hypothetical protein